MGCAASAPQDVDTLPIKAHCRSAFSRCSTTDNVNGQPSDNYLPNQSEEGYDVVLCYPLGGTVFGLELQARYEKMDTVSLWTLEHFLSVPGTPVGMSKSMSGSGLRNGCGREPGLGLEIRPAPEDEVACSSSSAALSREVRRCRRGVVVLVTAGCTWDEGVLTCLRLTGKFLRPLVMVHCVQSCPLPALEDWPPDVRPIIAASGPPVKYLAQHSGEALRHVEQRMVEAAAAPALTAAASQDQGTQAAVQQQQQQGGATQQQQGAVAPQTPPLQPPSRQQGQQQQPITAVSSNCGGCLDGDFWTQRPQKTQQQHQQPSQGPQSVAPAANAVAKTAEACAAAQGPALAGPGAGAAPAPVLGPDSGPHSLAALQVSNSDICRRASQLLRPWTCSGAPQYGSVGGAAAVSASASTLVETLLVVSARPSLGTNMLMAKGAAAGAPGSGAPLPARGAGPGSAARPYQQQQQQGLSPQQQEQQQTQAADSAGVEAGGGAARCVLHYRDPGWATPVAFLCAQLEAELGRANVCVQMPAVAGGACTPIRQPSPAPARGTAVRVSLQSVDSGGHWSSTWRQQATQRDQRRQQQAAVSATVSAAAAAAAAATLCGTQRSSSSSGSSSRCSASGGGVGGGIGGTGGGCVRLSGSTSRRTSGGLSPPIMARVEDELEAYAISPADDCTTPLLAAMSVSSSVRSAAASVAAPTAPLAEFQSVSWPDEGLAPPPPPPGGSGGSAACLVYFMSPGLSAPLVCLAELGEGLAAGRRVLLVVDGECCQRLPDYAPTGTTSEVWKAMGRLWQERLLYVPDYHTPFCALLKQGIVGAPSPR
ncbi:hypothetical protein PLESTB_000742200 [Pleodorina starrii]|uniref:Uncharacterized protein n=1 Tax=Pleodorina starrii TaxID=330485 RepID=A0A9W6F1Z8_9CHLO|nr:hypothetical protein PLESTM_000182500 [Pleodorina starrii]GLC53412.1 hypothetical protein PLESTB_000742200 [Pleodorina starrii]GLC69737.1 hypothetical protein PLESTF_000874400 [Pleodorina starrii]